MAHQFYSQLDTLIGQLKRSAIDAFMHTEYPDFYLTGTPSGGEEYRLHRDVDIVAVSAPDKQGRGGGVFRQVSTLPQYEMDTDLIASESAGFCTDFDTVRETIDSILEPWIDLPGLGGFDAQLDSCHTLLGLLTPVGAYDPATNTVVPAGASANSDDKSISSNLTAISSSLAFMKGDTVDAFKDGFLLRLESTISNDCAISILLGAAMSAEREVISAARTAVADLVDMGRQMFDDAARDVAGDFKPIFVLIAAAASGAALFLSGTVATALGAAGISIPVLTAESDSKDCSDEDEEEEENDEDTARTYNEAVTELINAFGSLDNDMRRAEQNIANYLISNLDSFRGKHRSLYDLTLSPIASTEEEMFVDTDVIRETADRYMSSLADCLKAAAEQTSPLDMAAAAQHHPNIGIGPVGPASQFEEVRVTLKSLLNDLAEEVDLGASNLRAAADMIDGSDAEAQQAFDSSVADIENYKNDPWTN